jgi:hypothetical protein
MPVDFSLQAPCDVRKSIPEPKLFTMVRHHTLAEFAQQQYKAAHPELDEQAIRERLTLQIQVKMPDGVAREMPAKLTEIFRMTKELDVWRSGCGPCRANVADRPFGCIGKINYPIAPEAESWLVSRLPADPQHPALTQLFKFLADLNIDGLPVDKGRANAKIFSLRRPSIRHWGEGPTRRTLTSSQLLHVLLFGGSMSPKQATLYTNLLNLSTVLQDPHPPSSNIEQFKTFFCAVVMAGRLNCALNVDS